MRFEYKKNARATISRGGEVELFCSKCCSGLASGGCELTSDRKLFINQFSCCNMNFQLLYVHTYVHT
jgi:hypothetical protein